MYRGFNCILLLNNTVMPLAFEKRCHKYTSVSFEILFRRGGVFLSTAKLCTRWRWNKGLPLKHILVSSDFFPYFVIAFFDLTMLFIRLINLCEYLLMLYYGSIVLFEH